MSLLDIIKKAGHEAETKKKKSKPKGKSGSKPAGSSKSHSGNVSGSRKSGNGSHSGSSHGSSRGSSSARGNISSPKPISKPKPQTLAQYLAGDVTYKQQLADLNRELAAYKANYTRQNQVTTRNFDTTQRQMNQQAAIDRMNQQYDFAGRGVLHSGVFAKALGDYNTDFNTKVNNLVQGKNDTLAQSKADLGDFNRQITLQQNAAKQDAIRRRQAQLGI